MEHVRLALISRNLDYFINRAYVARVPKNGLGSERPYSLMSTSQVTKPSPQLLIHTIHHQYFQKFQVSQQHEGLHTRGRGSQSALQHT